MRILLVALICLAVGFGAAYLLLPESPNSATTSVEKPQLYTCGMHPEIISVEPGVCPICNMNLTPKRDTGAETGVVQVDAATRQSMGLVTVPASYRTMTKTINTFGKVQVPDPNIYSITVKIDGWVERLFVSDEGEQVFRGQPLLEIYSPDLVAAQKEMLVALKSSSSVASMKRLAEVAEQRLRNWDISEDQLNGLKQTGKVNRTMTIRSSADGFVKARKVNEGDRVSARSLLYEVVDLSTVWIEAYVYEQDLPFVRIGQTGRFTTPGLPGHVFEARLTYISPLLDSQGQTEVRFALDNPDLVLKPEMYADVTIETVLSDDRLTVPRSAVINSGVRQLVFVATSEDSYEPRSVVTGAVDDHDMIEITDGLVVDEAVVVSGQFLLDSETRLSEAIGKGGSDPHAHHVAGLVHEQESDDAGDDESQPDDPYDIHTCPMPEHFHILNYGPGQCPDCGMDLVPVSETENSPVYICPMPECGVVSKEPGTCPVCNMNLVEYQPGGTNDK